MSYRSMQNENACSLLFLVAQTGHYSIEKAARECPNCQLTGASPPKAPLHPWEWPIQPWGRLHLDFAGPFIGHMYLVIVDAHSKWMNVEIVQ